LARWLAWRLASRMGLASRLRLGQRLASLGLGRGSALRLRSGLALLVGPVGPSLRSLKRATAKAPLKARRYPSIFSNSASETSKFAVTV
jgi:hypothetical protein